MKDQFPVKAKNLLPCFSATDFLKENKHVPFHNKLHNKLIYNTLLKKTTLHNKPSNKTETHAILQNSI